MNKNELLTLLFKDKFLVANEDEVFHGIGELGSEKVFILGTENNTYIGNKTVLSLSSKILDIVQKNNKDSILLLVDTLGQRLSHHDELLGINLYLAHLSKSIELARLNGHKIISIVRNQAVSGGALCTNLLADHCYALNSASIGVMNLPSMSRITQIPLKKLESLSETSPLFDTNVNNYLVMGALEALWDKNEDLPTLLMNTIKSQTPPDERRNLGSERNGRLETLRISNLVEESK
jgi:malonate decarboxylase gamma subunit